MIRALHIVYPCKQHTLNSLSHFIDWTVLSQRIKSITHLYLVRPQSLTFKIDPPNAEATFVQYTRTPRILKTIKTQCHVGIHWKALPEYFPLSTHVSRFQSFFRFLHHFVMTKLATSSIRINPLAYLLHDAYAANFENSLSTLSCLEMFYKRVLWTFDTFENKLRIDHKLTKKC